MVGGRQTDQRPGRKRIQLLNFQHDVRNGRQWVDKYMQLCEWYMLVYYVSMYKGVQREYQSEMEYWMRDERAAGVCFSFHCISGLLLLCRWKEIARTPYRYITLVFRVVCLYLQPSPSRRCSPPSSSSLVLYQWLSSRSYRRFFTSPVLILLPFCLLHFYYFFLIPYTLLSRKKNLYICMYVWRLFTGALAVWLFLI